MKFVYRYCMSLLGFFKRLVTRTKSSTVGEDGTIIYTGNDINRYLPDEVFDNNLVLYIVGYNKDTDSYKLIINSKYKKERSC